MPMGRLHVHVLLLHHWVLGKNMLRTEWSSGWVMCAKLKLLWLSSARRTV